MNNRVLDWEGCINVRDLGGLRTVDGRTTHRGAVVRSDTPARFTEVGWSALYAYGIRTIITLCTDGMVENELDVTPPYPDIATLRIAIEDVTDMDFVRRWASTDFWCTPLYYKDALQRWPQRHAAVISAIARAGPGGVLFHCVRGHDRTGIIALLLLALVGVILEEMIADYEQSPDPGRDQLLARKHTSAGEVIRDAFAGLDIDTYLGIGGASQDELAAVRRRLLGPVIQDR